LCRNDRRGDPGHGPSSRPRHRAALPMTGDRKTGIFALWRDEFGAALVEFTLLAPFLLFLGLGMSEFGRFLYQYQLVLDGLRDGARYLARLYDPTDATNQSNAANLAVTGTIDGSGAARVDGWAAADIEFVVGDLDVDNSAGTYRGGAIIHRV